MLGTLKHNTHAHTKSLYQRNFFQCDRNCKIDRPRNNRRKPQRASQARQFDSRLRHPNPAKTTSRTNGARTRAQHVRSRARARAPERWINHATSGKSSHPTKLGSAPAAQRSSSSARSRGRGELGKAQGGEGNQPHTCGVLGRWRRAGGGAAVGVCILAVARVGVGAVVGHGRGGRRKP